MAIDFGRLFDNDSKSDEALPQNNTFTLSSEFLYYLNQDNVFVDKYREFCLQYQRNIAKSDQLLAEIRKGVLTGEDIYSLFIKAVQAISCMTSNQLFETEIKENIKKIYGDVLKEPQVLELEMKEAQNRLNKLTAALQVEEDPSSLKRIRRAIEEHEKYISAIKAQLSSS